MVATFHRSGAGHGFYRRIKHREVSGGVGSLFLATLNDRLILGQCE